MANDSAAENRLADPLPPTPLPTLEAWFEEAKACPEIRNPDAIALGTVTPGGEPRVRMVLCRGFDFTRGAFTFYTNRQSAKAAELEASGVVAATLYWDPLGLQVRLCGPARRSADADSDRYFESRHPLSRIAAWASDQSRPIESRDALIERMSEREREFGLASPPRPPHWGGYQIVAETIELWASREGRLHDRAFYRRSLSRPDADLASSEWECTRLQP